jgi:hypothetical protein
MKILKVGHNYSALVDDSDYVMVSAFKWRPYKHKKNHTVYARTDRNDVAGVRRCLLMHRLILGIYDRSILVDHRDGDGLNNQRFNIRSCTSRQNVQHRLVVVSRSGFLGVTFDGSVKRSKPWKATIGYLGRYTNLGRYSSPQEAALAYNKGASLICGEFASLNWVSDVDNPVIKVA